MSRVDGCTRQPAAKLGLLCEDIGLLVADVDSAC